MLGLKPPRDLSGEQYLAIEDSLLSSEAGRAFLRMRDKRSAVLALDEYHTGLRSIRDWITASNVRSAEDIHLEVLRKELIEMAASIRKAKSEISAMKPADGGNPNSSRRINLATEELDAIVHATERATSDILNSAEHIMEIAARVRTGLGAEAAEALDAEATNILMACGFQDITGQRISKVVSTLRYLEERVDAMIRIWGIDSETEFSEIATNVKDGRPDSHLMNGPALRDGVDQNAVDALFASMSASHAPSAPAFTPTPSAPVTPPVAAVSAPAEPEVNEADWGLAPTQPASPPAPPPLKPAPAPAAAPSPPPPPPPQAAAPAPKKAAPPPPAPPPSPPAPKPELPASGELDQSSIDSLFP